METKENELFQNGATWLRVDFHLHTKAYSKTKQHQTHETLVLNGFSNTLEDHPKTRKSVVMK